MSKEINLTGRIALIVLIPCAIIFGTIPIILGVYEFFKTEKTEMFPIVISIIFAGGFSVLFISVLRGFFAGKAIEKRMLIRKPNHPLMPINYYSILSNSIVVMTWVGWILFYYLLYNY